MSIQGILLTGGQSRRMGFDKTTIEIDGDPLAHRIAKKLKIHCESVTVVGRQPLALPEIDFMADVVDYEGPLVALSLIKPTFSHVFVASCDLVRFDERIIPVLVRRINTSNAAMVFDQGFPQPLCALYRSECLSPLKSLVASGERKMTRWASSLNPQYLSPDDLSSEGLDPRCFCGANTPEELERLMARDT